MSYLSMYDGAKVEQVVREEKANEEGKVSSPVQAKFARQNLTNEVAQNILSTLEAVQAVNLSQNHLTEFPQQLSNSLLALDVSYNRISKPIALRSYETLLELNLSNNDITDLRGLSVLTSIMFLDLSENLISHVDGLENMKKLQALKLKFNRIGNFQGLRLLTYNTELRDVWLEGNPIEQDTYYKVKLLTCIPHLKNLDGSTVWRRTALQSQIVNDELKYSDLCKRTPGSVDKYAQLSRRSASQMFNDSVLNNFSASMMTMQALVQNGAGTPAVRVNNQQSRSHSATRSLPESGALSQLPPHIRRLNDVTNDGDTNYSAMKPHSHSQNQSTTTSSPKKRRGSTAIDRADMSLLPPHLQEAVLRLRGSPTKGRPGSPTKLQDDSMTVVSTSSARDRPRSALPWRNPPSIVPNLDKRFPRSRSKSPGNHLRKAKVDNNGVMFGTLDSVASASHGTGASRSSTPVDKRLSQRQNSGSLHAQLQGLQAQPHRGVHNVQHAPVATNSKHVYTRSQASTPANTTGSPYSEHRRDAPSPVRLPPKRRHGPVEWMHPALKPTTATDGSATQLALGPPPAHPGKFDSDAMELANHASLQVLQQSFDADRRAGSSVQRGRSRTRGGDPSTPRSARSSRSVATSSSPTGTRSSSVRKAFTDSRLRSLEEAARQERELVEARTYSRPSSPAPYQRNPAYTIHQGTSSPSPRGSSENNSTVYTLTSSKLQAFSPPKQPNTSTVSSRSTVRASSASPPRLTSTERILQHYSSRYGTDFAGPTPVVVLQEPKKAESPDLRHTGSRGTTGPHANTASDESKGSPVEDGAASGPPAEAAEGEHLDESPYRRFQRLRDRLSNKYMGSSGHDERAGAHASAAANGKVDRNAVDGKPHSHLYDYARQLNVDKVERLLNPIATSLDVQDISEVESKIIELQEQDLQFQKLKEQYQRQYQDQYELQLKEHEARMASNRSPPRQVRAPPAVAEAPPVRTAGQGPIAQSLSNASVHLSAPPPPAGYDVLYDLIQRRRNVLENIPQPSDISPEKSMRSPTRGPDSEGIFAAISDLRQRQSASVGVIQSATREHVVPAELTARGSLAQMSLSTPALHPSIQNYVEMASSPPSVSAVGAGASQGTSFLARLTTNNPYMPAFNSGASTVPAAPPAPAVVPFVPQRYQPVSYVTTQDQAIPAAVPARQPSPRRAPSPSNRGRPPRPPSPQNRSRDVSQSLSLAIAGLQSKQAADLRRFGSF